MIITYHGGACLRLQSGDTTLVLGPVSKASKKYKPTNFGADVAFLPMNHSDTNGASEASRGDKNAFVVYGPGEYEIRDITAAGFQTKSFYDCKQSSDKKTSRLNTVYSIRMDGLNVLYLGALGETSLPPEVLEMDAPDVLVVPIGNIATQDGEGTLTPAEAEKLAVKLEAKIIIPIMYEMTSLKMFLKEAGAENTKPVDKLTIKKKDVADKDNEVIVLAC